MAGGAHGHLKISSQRVLERGDCPTARPDLPISPRQSGAIKRSTSSSIAALQSTPPVRLPLPVDAHNSPCRLDADPQSRSCAPAPGDRGPRRPLSRVAQPVSPPKRRPPLRGRSACRRSGPSAGAWESATDGLSCQRAHAFVEIVQGGLPNAALKAITPLLTFHRRSRGDGLAPRVSHCGRPLSGPFRNRWLPASRALLPLYARLRCIAIGVVRSEANVREKDG